MIIVFGCGGGGDSGSGGGGVCVCARIRVCTRVPIYGRTLPVFVFVFFVSDVSDTFSIHFGLAYEVSDIFLGYRWQLLTVVFS